MTSCLQVSHSRFPETLSNCYSTHTEDLPKQTNYVEFDKERIEKWAKSIGGHTAKVIKRIFAACESRAFPFSDSVLNTGKTSLNGPVK